MSTTALTDSMSPMTELQAVNIGMKAIGENPITSLEMAAGNADSGAAIQLLGEVNREVQDEGWAWNTDDSYIIDPGTDGTIVLPSNALKVKQSYFDGGWEKRLVWRGQRLYDRKAHTFTIGIPVKVDLVSLLNFEDLPQAARNYIAYEAANRLVAHKLVSTTASKFIQAQVGPSRIRLEQAEHDADQSTMADNPHVAQTRRRRR